jgi:hypothetical protein
MRNKLFLSIILLTAGASLAWATAGFDHRAHVEDYGITCAECHRSDAPLIVPAAAVCLDCHEQGLIEMTEYGATRTHGTTWALMHRNEAKSKSMDCSACHQQNFCLDCHKAGFADEMGQFGNHMLNVHRSDFHVTHPIAARTDQQLCASCHESNFCLDCHTDFGRRIRAGGPSHQFQGGRGFGLGFNGDIDMIHAGMTPATPCGTCHIQLEMAPDFHTWSVEHAREARRNLATCQACHAGGDTCLTCHSARSGVVGFNPHGKNWNDRKDRLDKASGGRTCSKCH